MNAATHILRFQSLFHQGRAFAFPCDETGAVDVDELPDVARQNYEKALSSIGRDVAQPEIKPIETR